MARVAKVDNAFKKRFDRQEKSRSINTRQKLVYFFIICEGEKTEPNYFKAIGMELPRGTVELRIEGTGRNTISLIEYAIKQRKISCRHFDRVWVVFDKDDFENGQFNDAIALAQSQNIRCAWTNQAFELWFLLHFHYVTNAMSRKHYSEFLEREIRERSKVNTYAYRKNNLDTFKLLTKFGDLNQAIKWAKKLRSSYTDTNYATHNPSTCVHELIEELYNPEKVLEAVDQEE